MNEFWFLAFVITPAAVLALGWIAVVLHAASRIGPAGRPGS